MGGSLEDFAIEAMSALIGHDNINGFIINRIVERGRSRPHPWSTSHPYISWSGLTDRTFNARLLPAQPYPAEEKLGTRRPPIDDVLRLFAAAPSGQRPCPKSTCLFPAFAQYLTDGFIRTQVANDPPFGSGVEDRRRTTSNHEIDQSPLYGRNPAQTRVLRALDAAPGRRGRLKSQLIDGEEFPPNLFGADRRVKAEFRDSSGDPVLDLPLGLNPDTPGLPTMFAIGGDRANANPQVAMMNVLFLREHNRLAGLMEGDHPDWDDERVFETARNILIVMFIKIVVEEYINHINTSVFRFSADPSVAWEADWNRPNWMTAEFSLLYRWHSLVPERFMWRGVTVHGALMSLDNTLLIRDGLANAFVDISANNATEMGLGNSASYLAPVEGKAVKQARTNELATYNSYRRSMRLDPAESFEDIVGRSDDATENARRKALAAELKRLYGKVDNVEFYVGLFAEPREKNGPLPDLLTAMVAMDAFSQALTNPLLSRHIYGDPENRVAAFTRTGLIEIEGTKRLKDILVRNARGVDDRFVGMTRPDYRRD